MSNVIGNAAVGTIGLAEAASAAAIDLLSDGAALAASTVRAPINIGEVTVDATLEEARGLLDQAFAALKRAAITIGEPLP